MAHYFRALAARLRGLFGDRRADQELDDEIETHLRMLAERYARQGMTEAEAAWAARRQFGNVSLLQEAHREMRGIRFIETLVQDLRYGLWMLMTNPGFSATVLLTLALGIGSNTVIFSALNAVILRPLPYQNPDRLVMLWIDNAKRGVHEGGTSNLTFLDLRSQSKVFDDMAIFRNTPKTLAGDNPDRVMGTLVSANLFPMLGVRPSLGRIFSPEEEQRRDQVVVLSHGVWRQRFGAAQDAIGKTMELTDELANPRTVTIIGVMPEGFYFPNKNTQFWLPSTLIGLGTKLYGKQLDNRFTNYWSVIGRVKPNVNFEQARSEMNTISQNLAKAYPTIDSDFLGFNIYLVPLLVQVTGKNLQLALWVLLGVVGFVLLIACANVANLLLARGVTRERELAIRSALGAGRARLVRQLFTESMVLCFGASMLGFGLAVIGVKVIAASAPPGIPRLDEIRIDAPMLIFTLGISLLAGILFGLAPAWKVLRSDPNESLKECNPSSYGGLKLSQARGLLLVVECTLAVVLLAGAGLLIRSFARLQSVNSGFKPDNLLLVRLSFYRPDPSAQHPTSSTQIIERISALPGVQAVGGIRDFFLTRNPDTTITIEGRPPIPQQSGQLTSSVVTPGFLEAIGVPLFAGRYFYQSEAKADLSRGAVTPTIINETFAQRFFPGEDPIGQRIKYGGPDSKDYWYRIVGVVGDIHRQGLEKQPIAEFFWPNILENLNLVVRFNSDPMRYASAIRQTIHLADKNVLVFNLTTVERQMGDFSAQRRFQTYLLAIFAAVALVLSAIGVYGVMHNSVTQRRHEIGIRLALGAQGSDVLRLVIGQGMRLALIGVALGLATALALTRVLKNLLFEVSATDPATFALIAFLLAAVALIASYIPARRATKVDPLQALRHE